MKLKCDFVIMKASFRIVLFQIVMKQWVTKSVENNVFQNCVILDSNETYFLMKGGKAQFQNCVILDSNETLHINFPLNLMFQNCVILDSNETL